MLTEVIKREIEAEAQHCPKKSGAVIEALRIVQRHHGWVDDNGVREVAKLLDMTPDEVDSVATFYNLIHRRPVGRHVIRMCSSVSCWVMQYEQLRNHLLDRLKVKLGETTSDGRFTVITNQCLGACDHAPVLMIDDDLHQDLDPKELDAVLDRYA